MEDFEYLSISNLDHVDSLFATSNDPFDPFLNEKLSLLEIDESGLIPGTLAYKKARKRRQNRESAARSRARRKARLTEVEACLNKVSDLNSKISKENSSLKQANARLREELEQFKQLARTSHMKRQLQLACDQLNLCGIMQNSSVDNLESFHCNGRKEEVHAYCESHTPSE